MSDKLNLMMHCGGREVDRQAVQDSDTPAPFHGWHPIPHGTLVDGVERSLAKVGMQVVSEAHGLSREDNQYFGMFQVASTTNVDEDQGDYGVIVGMRNSHDKSFAASLALGAGVFVCDNLSFSGEVKLNRKHTAHIVRDLPSLTHRAVGLLAQHRKGQDLRIAAYKEEDISDVQAHDFFINALDAQVIVPSKLPKVIAEWRSPSHDDFKPRTAWSLFNSFTEILKGNVNQSLKRTQTLHGMMDSVCGLAG